MFESGGRFHVAEVPMQKVDTIAERISRQRFKTADGMPNGTVKAGGFEMSQENGLSLTVNGKTLRQLYRDTLALPENTPQLRNSKLGELAKLDRLLAERMILQNQGVVHYPTREQAELAQRDLSRDYPESKFTIEEQNGRILLSMTPAEAAGGGYLAEIYSRNSIVSRVQDAVKVNRGDAMPAGQLKFGGKQVNLDQFLDSTGLRKDYADAQKIPDGTARAQRLAELDKQFAGRIFQEQSVFTVGLSEDSAKRAIAQYLRDKPGAQYAFEKNTDGTYTVHRLG